MRPRVRSESAVFLLCLLAAVGLSFPICQIETTRAVTSQGCVIITWHHELAEDPYFPRGRTCPSMAL